MCPCTRRQEILRRQAEAKRADEKQAAKSSEKRRKAGLDMNKLEGLIARRSALGQEVKALSLPMISPTATHGVQLR